MLENKAAINKLLVMDLYRGFHTIALIVIIDCSLNKGKLERIEP